MVTIDSKHNRVALPPMDLTAIAIEAAGWRTHLQQHYRHDAASAIQYTLTNEPDRIFIERVLELLRTYVEVPNVGLQPQPADEEMLRLAQLTAAPMRRMGYLQEMNYLWPKLSVIAEMTGDIELYIIFVKFMAVAKGAVGEWEQAFGVYEQLVQHPHFQNATPALQANVLITHATALVWHGRCMMAMPLLQQCLALTQMGALPTLDAHNGHREDVPIKVGNTPLWETRAYALNQLGVLKMFSGEFTAAYDYFAEMYALFLAHGEEDNLACIAHQAIGRLYLYAKKYREADAQVAEGLPIRRRWNDREGIAVNTIYMAAAQIGLRHFARARPLLDEALAICTSLENPHDLALCHLYLGLSAWGAHQSDHALSHWQETVTLANEAQLHFVEIRLLIPLLPALFCRGHLLLSWQLLKMLWQSALNDQLSVASLWRFMWL